MNPSTHIYGRKGVVGDIVGAFEPTVIMTVYYDKQRLINGAELKLNVAQNAPRVLIGGQKGELYTLVMINPDAPNPSEPSLQELVSWIVTNIPGGTTCDQGMEFLSYHVPNPNAGIHRYIMLLYRQESQLNGIDALESRVCFNSRCFASKYNLKTPIGISYFHLRRHALRKA